MFGWGIIFLIIALLAAILGFGGILVGTALWAAKIVFIVAIIVWILSFFTGRGPSNPL